jgi:DNA-directed RNA polymerase subunit E'
MYKIVTVKDKIRVPPIKFSMDVEEAIKSSLEERWEGVTDRRLGVILNVVSIDEMGEGKILPGDGALYYPVSFKMMVYKPENHNIVQGEVIDVTEFGVFVRIGPIDGMIHVSQIMDDFVSFDPKNMTFTGKESKRAIKNKDIVRARIISVSLEKEYKIGLTTRQPGLGVLSWLEKKKKAEVKKGKPVKAQKKAAKEAKRITDTN